MLLLPCTVTDISRPAVFLDTGADILGANEVEGIPVIVDGSIQIIHL